MLYTLIGAVLFGADTIIKQQVEKKLDFTDEIPILKGKAFLTKYHNKGAFLDLGEKRPRLTQFIGIVMTLFCLLFYILSFGNVKTTEIMKAGMGILLGGAFSNSMDRLTRQYVVDYLKFNVKNKRLSRIVFNISDFGIMLGVLLALGGAFD